MFRKATTKAEVAQAGQPQSAEFIVKVYRAAKVPCVLGPFGWFSVIRTKKKPQTKCNSAGIRFVHWKAVHLQPVSLCSIWNSEVKCLCCPRAHANYRDHCIDLSVQQQKAGRFAVCFVNVISCSFVIVAESIRNPFFVSHATVTISYTGCDLVLFLGKRF